MVLRGSQGKVRQCKVCHGTVGNGKAVEAMSGMVRLGMAWQSGLGGVRCVWERLGVERQLRFGTVW